MEPCDGLSSSVKVFAKVTTNFEADAVGLARTLAFSAIRVVTDVPTAPTVNSKC